jgi:hypothetical protein
MIYAVLLSCLLVAGCFSCGIYDSFKYTFYNNKIGENLPDTFRTELPLLISHDHFYIQGKINHQQDMEFIIDTKATSLVMEDDLEKYKAGYWGSSPISSANAYGQKQKNSFYFFDSFEIDSISFGKPLFKKIPPTNHIYNIMKKRKKSILGTNILYLLCWKFSMDENKMILFSNKDTALIRKETEGYIQIKDGGRDKMNLFFFPVQEVCQFYLDLGYNGEIEIDKNVFNLLSRQFPFKKILAVRTMTLNDTIYVFENLDIQWNGISISNCQAIYVPTSNLNLVGAKFMQRFNFVLDYSDRKTNVNGHGIKSIRDLYILPAKNFHSIQSTPYISDFGFSIGSITEELIVSDIEIGGLAENAGMKLRDKLLSIDNGTFDIDQEDRHKNFIAYLAGKKQVTVQIEREGEVFDIKIARD